jgi:hypothetical protein
MRHPDAMPASATNNPLPDGLVRLRMHVNLAVQYGLLFAIVLGLAQMLFSDAPDWPARVIVGERGGMGGLLAGIVVSLIVGYRQWRAAASARDRRLAADPTADPTVDPGVTAEQTVHVPLARAEVLRLGDEAASALGRAHVRKTDEAEGTITLATGTSGWSWGEAVQLAVGPDDSGATSVRISSKPKRWAPIDGGANARNVERLATWLRDRAA